MTFGLRVQLIGEIGKEGLQTGEEGIVIASFQLFYKLADIKALIIIIYAGIKWYKKTHETITNFIIRKFQQIIPKTLIVILYSKITTLINQRNRIISFYTILREHRSWSFDAIK
ncbi:unknown [Bacteroides cellulosilyticus CAG:158]|nr:unknown [Bacteroides cellulosilyticus CAG:158]